MSRSVPTISVGAIAKLLQTLPGLGVDSAAACAEAHFDCGVLGEKDARVPLVELYALWEAVLARLARPDAALLVAQRYAPSDYGLVGFVCMNCATLGEALHHVGRYLTLWASEPSVRLSEGAVLEVTYRRPVPDRPGLRLATEAALAEILNGARLLIDGDLAPVEVCCSHPGPASRVAHEAFFKAPVRFGQPATLMRFTPAQLASPLARADPQLAAFLASLAEQGLAKAEEAGSLIDQLRKLLAEVLPKGMPELGAVARRLAMSERTLRRRLDDEGTSFRELLDETRAELARGYLRNKDIALSEVAFLLGFSEASAFHRAFRRWCGQTPVQYRQSAPARRRPRG